MCSSCELPVMHDDEPRIVKDVGRAVSRRAVLSGTAGSAVLSFAAALAGGQSASATEAGAPGRDSSKRPAHLELVLLGTRGGPPVDPFRAGQASALVVDGVTYVIDCGRAAVTQYVHAGLTLASMRAIFITHLHADHVADYYNFFLLGGSVPNALGDTLPDGVDVYGPGRAGGLPPKFGGGVAPTVDPKLPTPGIKDLTESCHDAYAYSSNLFTRDSGVRDIRSLANVHEIKLPGVGASYRNTAPAMRPFLVMQDEKVRVTAILVPHGPVFPAFAFRFDTEYGSVTFSGDTTYTSNIPLLAKETDVLVHEALNLKGSKVPPAFLNHLLTSHVEVQKVGSIAQTAKADRLVLSHIGDVGQDPIDVRKWERWTHAGYDGRVTVGHDLQRIRLH